ncbi:MAG: LmbZ [Gammaproteobacteria bacterium RIFCSPHIGHO2_12_FULL_38_14]|nr:MAG: LmbZ [Gammaproteobacteria bacterium RIFCSPHIGHO2_12_FULL_38_14]
MERIEFAIIGCGLIGQKRAKAIAAQTRAVLVACVDTDLSRAQALASHYHCLAFNDARKMLSTVNPDAVIIATTHESLSSLGLAVLRSKKHLFLEKPAGRNSEEVSQLMRLSNENKRCVRVGFNHRYHRAFQKAKKIIDNGDIGELMFVRARYGHGGRIGYDREWRANPALSGGGELIDQGVHLIDLSRWLLGDFTEISGFAHTYFWNMPVEDNGFLLLKTPKQQVAFLHASCTEWKNIFSFEIYGKTGKLHIEGLGGSYGVERLSFYKMLPEMGPPETYIEEFPMADCSWDVELEEFIKDIRLKRVSAPGLRDAYEALRVVESVCALAPQAL